MPAISLPAYPAAHTALLLVDPYNDFLAEGGKLWPRSQQVADAVGLHDNLRAVLGRVRAAALPVFIVPHHRAEPDDFAGWDHPTPYQLGAARSARCSRKGSWGGEWHPDFAPQPGDVVVKEHWGGSGFANTDLDFLLKQHGITHVILIGLIANTCIETTGRFAVRTGLPRHPGARRHRRVQRRGDARGARDQRADLRPCGADDRHSCWRR